MASQCQLWQHKCKVVAGTSDVSVSSDNSHHIHKYSMFNDICVRASACAKQPDRRHQQETRSTLGTHRARTYSPPKGIDARTYSRPKGVNMK